MLATGNGGPDAKTLWVGDIESWMDENHIANLFSKIGAVANVKIIRNKSSGSPAGYGFVEFASHEIAARVLQLFNGSINPETNKPSDNERNKQSQEGNNHQIYVSELDISTNKQHLLDHFKKKYNSIVDAKIILDQTTKLSKGYGFVQFGSYEEYQKALTEMQGTFLRGKPIKVNQGVSRNNGTGQNNSNTNSNNHSRSNSMNPAQASNQQYGQFYGLPTSPRTAGNILGGLGVQFKSPDGVSAQNGAQNLVNLQNSQGYAAYLQSLQAQAASQYGIYPVMTPAQQALFLGIPMKSNSTTTDPLTGAMVSMDGTGAIHPMQLSGFYPPSNVSLLNGQMGQPSYGYQYYMPQGGLGPNPAGQPNWSIGVPNSNLPKEEQNTQTGQSAAYDEIPIEIQSNNKLSVLNFMANYDPKMN